MDDTVTRLMTALADAEAAADRLEEDADCLEGGLKRAERERDSARVILRLCAQDMAAAYGAEWYTHPLYALIRKALGDE